MSSSSDSDNFIRTPPKLEDAAQAVNENLLPEKSRRKYVKVYYDFMQWKSEKNAVSFSENILLSYFSEKAQKYKPSSLWSMYSMLKSTLSARNDVNIIKYAKLTSFLKRKSQGFRSKKSKVLTTKDVYNFLHNAPDDQFLLMKVILILGIHGACHTQELVDLTTDDIEIRENIGIVKFPKTKTKIQRSFVITDSFYDILKKYMDLRPDNMSSKRVLLQYRNKKCTKQVVGKNKICSVAKEIATYLNLPNPEDYTGHCFRRTSATILADTGTDLTAIKRRSGAWKLSAVAEGYTENSIKKEKLTNNQITRSITVHKELSPQPSTSTVPVATQQQPFESTSDPEPATSDESLTQPNIAPFLSQTSHTNISLPGKNVTISFSNCNNLNINFI